MLKTLKFNSNQRRLFFLSDPHLNHKLPDILQKRGFSNPEDHTRAVIDSINKDVKKDDILFNIGDTFLNSTEEMAVECLDKIECQTIYTLWSNHPNPLAKIYKREVAKTYGDIEVYPFRWKNLVFIGDMLEMYIDNIPIVLCHYPLLIWNHMKTGSVCFSGHSHSGCKITQPDYPDGKIIDLSWETFKRPVIFSELMEIMNKKQISKLDDHH